MKRVILVSLMLISIILLLTVCDRTDKYTLSQPYENVEKVEIVYVANDNILVKGFYDAIKPVCTLDEEQWSAFFEDLFSMECSRYLNDPAESVTGEVVQITYNDGSFELIGKDSIFCSSSDREWDYLPYYFDDDVFYRFISAWGQVAQGT